MDGIAALGKWYLAAVPADTRVWLRSPAVQAPGRGPLGRPRLKPRLAPNAPAAQDVRAVAQSLARARWHTWTLKEGSKGPLIAHFAFVKVIDSRAGLPGTRQWLSLRRGLAAGAQTKYYLSNAPAGCSPSELVRLSGMRWPTLAPLARRVRVETAFEEGKGEVGLDHYETRTWRGWHQHMAQTFLAHFFLVQLRLSHKKSAGLNHSPARQLVAHAIELGLADCPDLMAVLDYRQHRNHAAYRSHRKRTLKRYQQRTKSKRGKVS